MKPCQFVLTTCPDAACAEHIARTLVSEGLAACVNIVPLSLSVYIWKGNVESSAELLLLIKAPVDRYPAIQERLLALHPYELPEIVAVPMVDGYPRYLAWLNAPEEIS